MFTDVHLLAAAFCNKERTKYTLDKLKLTKDGKAIASDGVSAIIVKPMPDKQIEVAENDIYIERDNALSVLGILKPTVRPEKPSITKFHIAEVTNKQECRVTQPTHGVTVCMPHALDGEFPDVEQTLENVNPKKQKDCKSVYISFDRLKEIIDQLGQMVKSGTNVEMFFAGQSEGRKAALRLETKGKNGEEIVVTLMQMEKYLDGED